METIITLNAVFSLALVVISLRLSHVFKMLDRRLAIAPASRVRFGISRNNTFPHHLVPSNARAGAGVDLYLFLSFNCSLCDILVKSLPNLAKNYTEVNFIVCLNSDRRIESLRNSKVQQISCTQLIEHLEISMVPYAIKVCHNKVVEYGIINTPDQMESVICSGTGGAQ